MPGVTLKDVGKIYKPNVVAVSNLSLTIKDKEFFCLLGPSGCGKSTTLAMIAGLEGVTEGNIFFGNTDVTNVEPRHRDIAMVFENYALYPHMTVFQNIAFSLEAHKVPAEEIKRRVESAADMLDIHELLNRKPSQLSGGQRQRVAIGRAIVRKPKIYLFDEPISHLDAKLRAHMRAEFKRLVKELNTTSIYVTHDQLEGMSMADSIAILNRGVLQQVGTPDEVYNTPINVFVAGFIGDPPINFIECDLLEENNLVYAVGKGFKVVLPERIKPALSIEKTKKFLLGIRPEHIGIHFDEKGNGIPAKVWITEPRGDDIIIDCEVDDTKIKVKSTSEKAGHPDVGSIVRLEINSRRVLLFDKETGLRISSSAF